MDENKVYQTTYTYSWIHAVTKDTIIKIKPIRRSNYIKQQKKFQIISLAASRTVKNPTRRIVSILALRFPKDTLL
jgi:hypothetical protein